ncbi:NACHT, LRR and PYD domains-containing protein 11 isoform X1 [Cebus imitator]|nr:NACHT, LRR and PYD domains-containing protein 11 isoform X1 [Cebus imitator]
MAEPDSTDWDLLWYLESLNDREFQIFKNYLQRMIYDFNLLKIPQINSETPKEQLAALLAISYEGQHIWNMVFCIFERMHKNNLCQSITDRRNRNMEACKALMRRKFTLQWENRTLGEFHYKFFCDIAADVFYVIHLAYDPTSRYSATDLNVFLMGEMASGKTMILRMAVTRWLSGDMWHNTISYIVPLTAHEINQMTNISLAELIAKDWPDHQAPIADILSDPGKVLFILEDLDNVRFQLNIDDRALCSDSTQRVPIAVLLVSLLKRKMAPGCWFLISSRFTNEDVINMFCKNTDIFTTLHLSNDKREVYFNYFFNNRQRALAALRVVHDNEMVATLCQVPILCWITCSALNQQWVKEEQDLELCCQTPTDVHAHFLAGALTSEAGLTASQYHLNLLKRLCSLAAGGLFKNTLNFSGEDFSYAGLTEADVSVLQTLNILLPSSTHKDCCKFIHLILQEFCAAIAYLMSVPPCQLPSGMGESKEKREQYCDFNQVFTFIYGLLNENRRKILETTLGFRLLRVDAFRQYSVVYMKHLGQDRETLTHHLSLFYCLFENQEEEFVKMTVDPLQEVTVYLQTKKDMMVSLYCLEHCHHMQTLKLSVQRIFESKEPTVRPTASQMKSLVYWRDICSLSHTMENLQELHLFDSDLNNLSERILSRALEHPRCRLRTLRLSYVSTGTGFEDLLSAVAFNRSLTCLSLNCMSISLNMFSLLHEILIEPTCQITHLSLMKCDLRACDCREIALLITSSCNLRKLTLSSNPLHDDGVNVLCEALVHPDCTLRSLVLVFCCLTASCCNFLGKALLLSPSLKELDLSVNHLKNYGALILIFPLVFSCHLEELQLFGCFLTTEICEYIALVIVANGNLKSLELGSNHIGDTGMQLICDALKQPSCKLVNIGLEDCMLTNACCDALASVFTTNTTLKRLNVLRNSFSDEGIVKLLESLMHPNCTLEIVGLPLSGMSTETQQLLTTVKERKPTLIFLSETWSAKEGREIGVRPLSQLGSIIPNSNLQHMFSEFSSTV